MCVQLIRITRQFNSKSIREGVVITPGWALEKFLCGYDCDKTKNSKILNFFKFFEFRKMSFSKFFNKVGWARQVAAYKAHHFRIWLRRWSAIRPITRKITKKRVRNTTRPIIRKIDGHYSRLFSFFAVANVGKFLGFFGFDHRYDSKLLATQIND